MIGHWLAGFSGHDISGNNIHGQIAGDTGSAARVLTVPHSSALNIGTGPFTISAKVKRAPSTLRELGSIFSKFDKASRKGINVNLFSSSPGYCGQGSDAKVFAGIDSAAAGSWQDCGRPGPISLYSNAACGHDGDLFVGAAASASDHAAIYRYKGGQSWENVGTLGTAIEQCILTVVSHGGSLYAATSTYNWYLYSQSVTLANAAVFRRESNGQWTNLGSPVANCKRIIAMGTYNGKLLAIFHKPDYSTSAIYSLGANDQWELIANSGHLFLGMGRAQGKLLIGSSPTGAVFRMTGTSGQDFFMNIGNPYGSTDINNQSHVTDAYDGKAVVGVWPSGKVGGYNDPSIPSSYADFGGVPDATEINSVCEYNGKYYAGALPYGDVARLDAAGWTRMVRFRDAAFGFVPNSTSGLAPSFVNTPDRTRLTSLSTFGGKLFATVGSLTGNAGYNSADCRGKVYSFEAGHALSYDRDIGLGWNTVTLRRSGTALDLFINGELSQSRSFTQPLDISNGEPLIIGNGPAGLLDGWLRDVKLWGEALDDPAIAAEAAVN